MYKKEELWAIFWCNLLMPVLQARDIVWKEVCAFLRALTREKVTFPDGVDRYPALTTLKRKYQKYRDRGGLKGVCRKSRKDRGSVRAVPPNVMARAIELKKEQPKRSPAAINEFLEAEHGRRVARSTMFRHLKQAGATRMKLGVVRKPVRKRWTVSRSNEMWIGDFSHGPRVIESGLSVPTRLSAILDVYSRYPISVRYYLGEDTDVLCDSLVRGMGVHGAPLKIYLDNAKVYHGNALKRLCARAEIQLLHRKAYDPEGGGLIERFIQTTQNQFETEVRGSDILTLAELNRGLSAWIEVMYLKVCHGDAKETPGVLYEAKRCGRRHVDPKLIEECFARREKRTVDRTFSDVRVQNLYFRVDQKYRGDRVWVEYDLRYDTQTVRIYSFEDEFLQTAYRHGRETGEEPREKAPGPIRNSLLNVLTEKQRKLREEDPVSFQGAATERRWPLESYLKYFANLLGRKGGVSEFSAKENEVLAEVHAAHPGMTRTLLKRAFGRASDKTIQSIIFELQKEELQ